MTTSSFIERISQLSPKRLALLAIDLQRQLDAVESQRKEPIAIIGMACRFPGGANDPAAYWQLLQNGVDAISEVPASRWSADEYYDPDPDAPGKISTRWAGLLDNVDQFDPQFFGISPREAVSMDPQQRLALEVGWEALENAGYAPDRLNGSKVGVFTGICNNDYFQLLSAAGEASLDTYTATGSAHSVVSGRLSYVLGLQGPSLSVDTACSSSLVALHLAVQSLRQGECEMALAGGVNVLASVEVSIALSKGHMMAKDGRCKAFDAAADGFVRAEGCGLVVLKPLSKALANRDNILALIRGSAINQDGRSNGLTAPNGPSQETVIRAALANAGVEAKDVSYVETHGTGTSLGDPIEAQALGAVLGSEQPVIIGSVKTNFGHLESAAGVAGLIKLILALQHQEIPPNLHFKEPSPHIPWADLPLKVPTQRTPWTTNNGRRIAGVSSFGFSGTNVHMVVEEAPPQAPASAIAADRPLQLFTLSARSESALEMSASRFEQYLAANPNTALADICYTANVGRAALTHRLAIVAEQTSDVQKLLGAFLSAQGSDKVISGKVPTGRRPETVFLFTGQGSQYINMGRQLYETQPVFRATLDKCDALLQPYLEESILKIIYPDPAAADQMSTILDETRYTQPALFALEYALAKLWQSWGIEAAAVMGHSLGEYVAACLAGVFSLADGLKLIAARGRLMQRVSAGQNGEMAIVFGSEARVTPALAAYNGQVTIAAVNGPETVVISGEQPAVQAVLTELKDDKIRGRRLAISVAGHSPLMDPIMAEFEEIAGQIEYFAPQIELFSGVTGQTIGAEVTEASYWVRHLREPVQFYPAIQTMVDQGYRVFLEIGANPTLIEMGQRGVAQQEGIWLPSLRSKYGDWQQLLQSLAVLYVQGIVTDLGAFEQDYAQARQRLVLPNSPFEKARYWVNPGPTSAFKKVAAGNESQGHPLLGKRLRSPALKEIAFEAQLNAAWPPFLAHHRIYDMIILPSPAYIEMALAAAQASLGPGSYELTNFMIQEALVLPAEGWLTSQLILEAGEDDQMAFRVVSTEHEDDWKLHVSGKVRPLSSAEMVPILGEPFDVARIQARCPEEISGEVYYEKVRLLGLEFGPDFQGIVNLWRRDGEALGLIALPESLQQEASLYNIHPAFLDACFHLLGAPLTGDLDMAYLLIGLDRFCLYRKPESQLWNHTILEPGSDMSGETFIGHIRLFDQAGQLVAEVEGLSLKRARREALLPAHRAGKRDWLYQVQWQAKSHPAAVESLLQPSRIISQIEAPASLAQAQQDYQNFSGHLDKLCTRYIIQALEQLGLDLQPGETYSAASLAGQLNIQQHYVRLLGRLLEILGEDNILKPVTSGWQVVNRPESAAAQQLFAALLSQYPTYEAQLTLLEGCGSALAAVLSGEQDPLHLLFPGGSLTLTEQIYQESPLARAYQTLLRDALLMALGERPEDRPLRILEVGAGTGSTTSYLLPSLPAKQTEYIFSDMSPLFSQQASQKFKDYPFIKYQLLDIEADPAGQGLAGQQFDIVVAANVVHATADLRRSLRHIRQLLAPKGMLILLEGTNPQRWVDLTFGLTEGWWKFSDLALRPDYPLIQPDRWLELLSKTGFDEAGYLPAIVDPKPEQVVILAQAAAPEEDAAPPAQAGHWLILADRSGLAQKLAEQLQERGDRCHFVWPGQTPPGSEDDWQLDPASPQDFQQMVTALMESSQLPWRGIVNLWGLDDGSMADMSATALEEAQILGCGSTLHMLQALDQHKQAVPLWLVTRGVQALVTDAVPSVSQAPLWGLGRVIALENPELWGGLVDLDPTAELADSASKLFIEICQPDGEDQVAWRKGQRSVARLSRAGHLKGEAAVIHEDGAYLITGGLGGLGLKVAHWLAQQGARYVVLVGRRGLPARAEWETLAADSEVQPQIMAIQAIEAMGAVVDVQPVDIAQEEQVSGLLQQFGQSAPPLKGIIHAAAALSGGKLSEMPLDLMLDMFKPKVTGTWHLHRLSQDMDLDFFCLFSSTTALWGSAELGHYAAANNFLDGMAHYRRGLGLPAITINWGTWDEMRVASTDKQQMVRQFGLERMASPQALAYLGGFLTTDVVQVTVADVDWSVLKPAYESRRQRPFLEYVETAHPTTSKRVESRTESAAAQQPHLLGLLEAARLDDRYGVLVKHIQKEVCQVLGIDSGRPVDVEQGLFDVGLDSLMAVELKNRLEVNIGQALPSTLIFNYPTVTDLATYLSSKISLMQPDESADAATKATASLDSQGAQADPVEIEADISGDMDDLSEDELASLLLKKLDQLQ